MWIMVDFFFVGFRVCDIVEYFEGIDFCIVVIVCDFKIVIFGVDEIIYVGDYIYLLVKDEYVLSLMFVVGMGVKKC